MSDERGCVTEIRFLQFISDGLGSRYPASVASGLCFYGVDPLMVAAEFMTDAANSEASIPAPTVHGGRLPGWVTEGTDLVLISYSGDCPEVIRAYDEVRGSGVRVHCLTSGGALQDRCMLDGNILIGMPSGLDEPSALGFAIGALAGLMSDLGILDLRDRFSEEVRGCPDDLPQDDVDGIARSLSDRVSSIYSTSDIRACAMWWRHRMCSRRPAFWGELPEFDHNELVGWSDPNAHAPELMMVVLRGSSSYGLVSKIVECMLEVLDVNGREVTVVDLGNGDVIRRNLRGILLAEAVLSSMGGSA